MATSVLGAGYTAAGVTAAGFGTPATADGPNALAGAAEARAIDPVTKDYRRDADGNIEGATGAQQRVYLAMATVRGSAGADLTLGLETPPDRITSTTLQQSTDDVRRALAPMVADGSIAITAVEAWQDGTRIMRRVRWVDLTTGREQVTDG